MRNHESKLGVSAGTWWNLRLLYYWNKRMMAVGKEQHYHVLRQKLLQQISNRKTENHADALGPRKAMYNLIGSHLSNLDSLLAGRIPLYIRSANVVHAAMLIKLSKPLSSQFCTQDAHILRITVTVGSISPNVNSSLDISSIRSSRDASCHPLLRLK